MSSSNSKKEPTNAQKAHDLLKEGDGGILATINGDKPYVSSTPFVLNKEGQPVIFISDLARHTKNLDKNGNASLIVNKPDADGSYFNGSRVTLSGEFVIVDDADEIATLRKIYMDRYKEAEEWADLGDFNYYKLDIKDIYFIGGFGEIHGIELDDYKKALDAN